MGEALVKEKTVRTRCHITVTQMSSQRDERVGCYQDKCIALCEFCPDKRHQSSVNEKKEAALDAIAHFGNNLPQYPRM